MAAENRRICVIDMGSAHISAVIAEIHATDKIEILGLGHTQNRGMQRGKIIDMDKVVACLKQAVSYAEDMADLRVHTAWLCISSTALKSFNCSGRVAVADVEISTTDIVRTLARAKQEHLLDDYYLVNHFQHGISINDSDELTMSPIDMVADQIEAYYHLMMIPINVMQNLQQAMHLSSLHIEKTLVANIASSAFALLPEEREQGVCLVDIGAGTTSISVYGEDKLILTHCLPVGGYDVTRDIASELRMSMAAAERIKLNSGRVNIEDIDCAKMISIPASDGMPAVMVSARELGEIMAARYEEILHQVLAELDSEGLLPVLKRGIVYCGGGVQVLNFARFATKVTGISAQIANFPPAIMINDSDKKRLESHQYQTACGALIYSQSEHFAVSQQSEPNDQREALLIRLFVQPFNRFIEFLRNVF